MPFKIGEVISLNWGTYVYRVTRCNTDGTYNLLTLGTKQPFALTFKPFPPKERDKLVNQPLTSVDWIRLYVEERIEEIYNRLMQDD